MIDKNMQKRIEELMDRGSDSPKLFSEDSKVVPKKIAIYVAEMAVKEVERRRQEAIDEDPFEQIPNQ